MTKESKQAVLNAYDELLKVAIDSSVKSHHPKGGSYRCGECGGLRASSFPHQSDCAIGNALKALRSVIPYYENRPEWLISELTPAEFVAQQTPVS